jgi:hypothetical protein
MTARDPAMLMRPSPLLWTLVSKQVLRRISPMDWLYYLALIDWLYAAQSFYPSCKSEWGHLR